MDIEFVSDYIIPNSQTKRL